jgi:cell division inhibitor SepF
MSMWRRAMDYLGLSGDDAYETYDPSREYEVHRDGMRETDPRGHGRDPYGESPSRPMQRQVREDYPPVRRIDDSGVNVRPAGVPRSATVRTVGGPSAEPVTVSPRTYNDAQEIADHFKLGQPVIINLEGVDAGVSRRIVDFASGMCYALSGGMERIAQGVYLVKPSSHDH